MWGRGVPDQESGAVGGNAVVGAVAGAGGSVSVGRSRIPLMA